MARIILIGFPGAGKSTVGKKLAVKLHYRFFDLDSYFEEQYRLSVPLFFEKYDERAFRICERRLLLQLLNEDDCVISTGGGTPCFFDTMDVILSSSVSVYLRMAPKSLWNRLKSSRKQRPLIFGKNDDELMQYIEKELASREVFYMRSNLVVKGESIDIQELAANIAHFLI